ncbi:MAG: exodeoxyribonuclease VII small subunit, partial [Leptospirillum sp.]
MWRSLTLLSQVFPAFYQTNYLFWRRTLVASRKPSHGTDSFEKKMARLEEIVSLMEEGGLPLEKAIALFEEGDRKSVV